MRPTGWTLSYTMYFCRKFSQRFIFLFTSVAIIIHYHFWLWSLSCWLYCTTNFLFLWQKKASVLENAKETCFSQNTHFASFFKALFQGKSFCEKCEILLPQITKITTSWRPEVEFSTKIKSSSRSRTCFLVLQVAIVGPHNIELKKPVTHSIHIYGSFQCLSRSWLCPRYHL